MGVAVRRVKATGFLGFRSDAEYPALDMRRPDIVRLDNVRGWVRGRRLGFGLLEPMVQDLRGDHGRANVLSACSVAERARTSMELVNAGFRAFSECCAFDFSHT